MNSLIGQLENILRSSLSERERSSIDLTSPNSPHRAFYFNCMSEGSAKEAIHLFSEGEAIWERYKVITQPNVKLSNSDLCEEVYTYLKSVAYIMENTNLEEMEEALIFLKQLERHNVLPSEDTEEFRDYKNVLHHFAYGMLANFVIDELPEDPAYWVLYDWAMEQGHVANVACYLLQDCFESEWARTQPLFDSAIKLWQSGNFNRYWLKENSFDSESNVVLCNTISRES